MSDTKTCPSCSRQVAQNALKCPTCGHRFVTWQKADPGTMTRAWVWFMIIGIVLLLLVAAA